MSEEGITRMQVGRELDTLVAEKAMEWARMTDQHPEIEAAGGLWRTPAGPRTLLPFSADINRAIGVAEKLHADGWHFEMGTHISKPDVRWATFARGDYDIYDDSWSETHQCAAPTLPHAICLAALRAMGHDVAAPTD